MLPGELPEDVIPQTRENASPGLPPVPQEPPTGQQGIETARMNDNLQSA
jgi:hypothetical protein